ncbi:hypothetical protein BJ875DRAFT_448725 [Amylocarpus encephaloides]|uniref:Uncharacterized protein n=1 Tax=Amylocarpus encephaloides TaxID=45428 RepID=A0A9P7YUC1_9HELO|nr:hypothetical protein BJ875DRAFT_448725 [Amylocarpus encephaloides]
MAAGYTQWWNGAVLVLCPVGTVDPSNPTQRICKALKVDSIGALTCLMIPKDIDPISLLFSELYRFTDNKRTGSLVSYKSVSVYLSRI